MGEFPFTHGHSPWNSALRVIRKENKMETKRFLVCILALTIFCSIGVSAFAAGGSPSGNQNGANLTPLTDDETATLKFMREEEKLARDVYLVMYEQWESAIFSNIAKSEQRHMDALKSLLDKYGLPDPAPQKIGVFSDLSLQELYNELISRGQQSVLDAYRVGGLIEEIDIKDLKDAIEETDRADLERVYMNLLSGSYNHLRAFVSHIESLGVTYVAQYLSQAEVDAILGE